MSILFVSCAPPGPVVQVTLEFVAPKGMPPLNAIEMMSGADKTLAGGIAPGTTDTYKLYPSAESESNELVLFIYLLPETQKALTWEGKRFPQGSSYKTHIRINEKGKVLSQRSCVTPCEL